jgi:hypothetical protein
MITTRRINDLDLMVLTGTGSITTEEVMAAMEEMYAGSPTRLVLWDLSHADITSIGFDDVKNISKLTVRYAGVREDGKTAIIAAQQVAFGIGRVYESLLDGSSEPIRVQVFWTLEEALAFLGLSELPPE